MEVLVKVWGPYACFTRPEFSTERKSYDIITPSAARNILEAIYWHPGLVYTVKKIWVRKPIRFTNVRRNEVSEVISMAKVFQAAKTGTGDLYLPASNFRQQRMSTILRDVEYYILADMTFDRKSSNPSDSLMKFYEIFTRRLESGRCFSQPYFGTREFMAFFEPCKEEDIPACPGQLRGEKDLGVMLYDMDFSNQKNIKPMFFHPIMRDGCVEVSAS